MRNIPPYLVIVVLVLLVGASLWLFRGKQAPPPPAGPTPQETTIQSLREELAECRKELQEARQDVETWRTRTIVASSAGVVMVFIAVMCGIALGSRARKHAEHQQQEPSQ